MNDLILRLRAPAKINLTLDIVGRRADGYHDISSVMQQISLFDGVDIELNDTGVISVSSNAVFIPRDRRNICYQAAEKYFAESGIRGFGVEIYIKKLIPTSAGLAGGSSDGAAVLRGLEKLFGRFGDRLSEMAAGIGADIPFCLTGGSCLCEGIGDRLTPLEMSCKERIHLVIAKNTRGLSTPEIYRLYDDSGCTPDMRGASEMTEALKIGNPAEIARLCRNGLEPVSIGQKPEIAELKKEMMSMGALGAMMSGSGPSVFGIFENEKSAKLCASALKNKKIVAYHAYFLRKGE